MHEEVSPAPLIVYDQPSRELAASLADRLGCQYQALSPVPPAALTVLVVASGPVDPLPGHRCHYVFTGAADDLLDAWDTALDPDLVGSCLLLGPAGREEHIDALAAWAAAKSDAPATPLAALSDESGRAMRWSVIAARAVAVAPPAQPDWDDPGGPTWDDVYQLIDEHATTKALARAVPRVAAATADSCLQHYQALLAGLNGLDDLTADIEAFLHAQFGVAEQPWPPTAPDLAPVESALAAHLREVQRSGFGRWTGAKRRTAARDALQQAAKDLAGGQLQSILQLAKAHWEHARSAATAQRAATEAEQVMQQTVATVRADILVAAADAAPWAHVELSQVHRPWGGGRPRTRSWVVAPPQMVEDLSAALDDVGLVVRADVGLSRRVLLVSVQSGLPLTALRYAGTGADI